MSELSIRSRAEVAACEAMADPASRIDAIERQLRLVIDDCAKRADYHACPGLAAELRGLLRNDSPEEIRP